MRRMLFVLAFPIAALAADLPMPFEERDCGTIGNALATFVRSRDAGISEKDLRNASAEALKACIEEHGKDGCSIRTHEQAQFVSDAIGYIYAHPEIDQDFAQHFYELCKAAAVKGS
jgi:hypothetical protein